MATVVTYLLISNPDDPDAIRSHPMLEKHGFEPQPIENREEQKTRPALRFAVANNLEDEVELEGPCRKLSTDFPEATVTLCEVEERFDQVEHLRSVVFIGGKPAGEIEHGYVFNIGA